MAIDDAGTDQHERGAFADTLREWRRVRGMSQLDLALAIDASARHLSFMETGRARPSRDMAERLCEALMLPRAARNAMLTAAGFAPLYPATPLEDEALGPFRAALQEMMERHAPNPALLCDRRWTILDANTTARTLLSTLHGEGAGEMNMIRMLTQSPRAPEVVLNLGEVLEEMAGRIRLEALEAGQDPELLRLLDLLETAQDAHPPPRAAAARRPLVPLIVRGPAGPLKFLSAIAQFGTSEDVTIRDIRLELLFPADSATRAAMAAFSS
ncbi:MAG: helix-turn-helix domain-containing protein [Alphaproteobacteria bacterium]|nr:helix-turn-helix domain-containing protein [Alphaproteobacteria bacterium]